MLEKIVVFYFRRFLNEFNESTRMNEMNSTNQRVVEIQRIVKFVEKFRFFVDISLI